MSRIRLVLVVSASLAFWPTYAFAGMPHVTTMLTEAVRLRLQNISFFLAGFLLSAWVIQRLWNSLRRDMTILPRLSYLRAVALVGLWGMLFVLVLTMISGTRELMTPGAWEPAGITYRLKKDSAPPVKEESPASARREQLARLKDALWQYARSHSGKFPSSPSQSPIPNDLWQLPDVPGARYVYVGGAASVLDVAPLAYEPEVNGSERLVLFSDGAIRLLTTAELMQIELPGEQK